MEMHDTYRTASGMDGIASLYLSFDPVDPGRLFREEGFDVKGKERLPEELGTLVAKEFRESDFGVMCSQPGSERPRQGVGKSYHGNLRGAVREGDALLLIYTGCVCSELQDTYAIIVGRGTAAVRELDQKVQDILGPATDEKARGQPDYVARHALETAAHHYDAIMETMEGEAGAKKHIFISPQ